jgi:hypothetical protein
VKLRIIALALVLCATVPADAVETPTLIGAWRAVTYVVDGKPYPLNGLFIFTAHHYSANVRFKMSAGPNDDANGNAGPYTVKAGQVVFSQWVQIHVRPGSATEPILSRAGPDEAAEYRVEGKRLVLTFPSKNQYILERVAE